MPYIMMVGVVASICSLNGRKEVSHHIEETRASDSSKSPSRCPIYNVFMTREIPKWRQILGLCLFVMGALASSSCGLFSDNCAGLGITSETPLGTLKCFDRHLRELGLQQTPSVKMSLPDVGLEALPSIGFLEQGKPSALAGGESFNVFVDNQGTIRALLGNYNVSSEVHGAYTTVVSKFLVNYWMQLSEGNPNVASQLPDGRQRISMMSQGPVRGQWTKGTSLGQILVYVKK